MNYFTEILSFQHRLHIPFNDHRLLITAFAHPSFIADLEDVDSLSVEQDKDLRRRMKIRKTLSKSMTYPKLSVLGYEKTTLAIKDELYKLYPNITPHICLSVTDFLMSRETVANVAKNISIADLLLVSRELDNIEDITSELHLNFSMDDILCDTFYSLVGAIDTDLGEEASTSFVKDFLVSLIHYEDLDLHVNMENPKDQLSQILQLNRLSPDLIELRTIAETGVAAESPVYYIGVYYNSVKIGHGVYHTVPQAREQALKNTVYACLEGDVDLRQFKNVNDDISDEVSSTC